MQKNVGTIDAIMRITGGLVGLVWATACMIRHPYRRMPLTMTPLSAMKVAEGITRFCPMLKILGTNTLEKKAISNNDPSQKQSLIREDGQLL